MKKTIFLLFLSVNISYGMWVFGPQKVTPLAHSGSISTFLQGACIAGLCISAYEIVNDFWGVDLQRIDLQNAIKQDQHVVKIFENRLKSDDRDQDITNIIKIYEKPMISCFQDEIDKKNRYANEVPDYLVRQYNYQFEQMRLGDKELRLKIRQVKKFQATADQVLSIVKRT